MVLSLLGFASKVIACLEAVSTTSGTDSSLELKLDSELKRPGPTDLIQRIQTAGASAAAQTSSQHRCGPSERVVNGEYSGRRNGPERIRRVCEIRMIENIEKLGPELQVKTIRKIKLATHCQIQLMERKPAQ